MNAIIYTRFSPRPKKKVAECESCETQEELCRKYAAIQGYEVVAVYADRDVSGGSMKGRPEFLKALEHACREKLILIVYSLSRFARSTTDALLNAKRLNDAGAGLVSIKEQLDTTTPMGRFVYTILAALDQLERERTAERTSDFMRRHQANGRRMSRRVPYGWMEDPTDKRRIVPIPSEQAILHRLRHYRDLGLARRRIGEVLEKEGHLCRGHKWHHTTVRNICARLDEDWYLVEEVAQMKPDVIEDLTERIENHKEITECQTTASN